jgi:curli biogenesis system outer membrane secretion channel CsgG
MIHGGIAMRLPHYWSLLVINALVFTVGGSNAMAGEPHKPDGTGVTYNGPTYTIAIIKFANKTPSKILGIGEAATDILRTHLKAAGLEPIDVTEDAQREQDELIKLQQTGAVKTGKKNAAEGFESIDYRVQGAVTAYSEVEEGSDMLFYQKKTQVARVVVDYSLIDIATGQSLLAESGVGEWRKETGGALGFGSRSTADTGLRDGALRDALSKALEKMITKLNSIPYQSRILLIENQTVVIRGGEKSKLPIGTKLGVYRAGQDLLDPETGRSLGKREKMVGEIILTSHQNDRISEGRITFGNGFQTGDLVRVMKQ